MQQQLMNWSQEKNSIFPTRNNEIRKSVTTFVEKAYSAYLKKKLGTKDKSWAPHRISEQCRY